MSESRAVGSWIGLMAVAILAAFAVLVVIQFRGCFEAKALAEEETQQIRAQACRRIEQKEGFVVICLPDEDGEGGGVYAPLAQPGR